MLRTLVSEFDAGSRIGLVVTESSSSSGEVAEDDGPCCAGIAGKEPWKSSVSTWIELV